MSKRKKKVVPDEVMESDLLRISRHGKDVIMENLQNQEKYERFMEQQAERYPMLCKEINDAVSEIAGIVVKHKPLPLLNRAYQYMAHAIRNIETESKQGMAENTAHQWLLYLQNAIASNPPDNNQAEDIKEEDYMHLSKLFATMYSMTHLEYHICKAAKQKKDETFNEDTAEIEAMAQSYYNGVSGKQYSYFQSEILYKLLSPHDAIIQKLFGINVQDFVEDTKKIQTSLATMGTGQIYDDLIKILEVCDNNEVFQSKLNDALNTYEPPPELTEGFEPIFDNNPFGPQFDYDLFDLQKITNLPIKLLEALSLSPGEDKEFMDKDEPYAGWPFKRYPSRLKPFLKVDGRYYCFHAHNLADHIYRTLNKAILNAEPSYGNEWQIKQGEIGEEYTFELFAKLLPGAQIYRNVKYKWYPNESESKKMPCEADGIIIFDDNLFIVEVKSGAFSPHSPITDSEGFHKSMKNLVEKPYEQGRRLHEYLKEHENGAPLSNHEGNHLVDIRLSDYRHVIICCVTLEQLTDFGGQLSDLKKIGTDIDLKEHPVWAISIDDLRIYADLIQSPLVFCHYLEKRNDALTKVSNLKFSDEFDHYGAYLKHNDYARKFSEYSESKRVQSSGYRDEIDIYYYNLHIGEQPSLPSQKIAPLIKQIIEVADNQQKVGRCRAVGALLDLTQDEQNEFSNSITNVLAQQKTSGIKMFVNFSSPVEITISCEQDGVDVGTRLNIKEQASASMIKEQALASMINANAEYRHLIELKFAKNDDLYNIDYAFLKRTDINAFNQVRIQEIAKAQASKRLATKGKTGRNEPCPCGSGIKYKKCCGG